MDNKDMVGSTETEQVEETTQKTEVEETKERMYSRSELNKILNAEKNKMKDELIQEYETKRTEAEKLAKMDAEQKLNYELEQRNKENEELKNQLNSLTLRTQANTYATEKGLPLGYIEDLDYAKETAESIKDKVDKLTKLRSADIDTYLKDKLKQTAPKAVGGNEEPKDPFLEGFRNYMSQNKRK